MNVTSNQAVLIPDTGRRRKVKLVFLFLLVLDPQNGQVVLKL